jgi:hypothetical protein
MEIIICLTIMKTGQKKITLKILKMFRTLKFFPKFRTGCTKGKHRAASFCDDFLFLIGEGGKEREKGDLFPFNNPERRIKTSRIINKENFSLSLLLLFFSSSFKSRTVRRTE